jgi:hypothetical protein
MHTLAATLEQRPHPPVPIAGRSLGQLVDLNDQVCVAIGASLVAERRALQLQQDTGSALRKLTGD